MPVQPWRHTGRKGKRMEQLYTRWGRDIDSGHVLQEYPRPLLQRESYVNLNGYWEYAVTKKNRRPEVYDGRILVPFSPESVLSGVSRQLQPDEYLWYRTKLPIEPDKLEAGCRLILHFGAVDQACQIYVNGQKVSRHMGGYLPFSVDITEYCSGNCVSSVPSVFLFVIVYHRSFCDSIKNI